MASRLQNKLDQAIKVENGVVLGDVTQVYLKNGWMRGKYKGEVYVSKLYGPMVWVKAREK